MEYYLDHTASTKPSDKVIRRMTEVMEHIYGNPSALHVKGMEAEKILISARKTLADDLHVKPSEIYFNSGGTEGNNMAIFGAITHEKHALVTSRAEHASVKECAKFLKEKGYKVTYLAMDEYGRFDMEDIERVVKTKPRLVSLMLVNNETGIITDVEQISKLIKRFSPETLFHVDGIQAYGKLNFYPKEAGVDIYTLTAHKIRGPKGIGAMYVNETVHLQPLIFGGKQERGLRSGTENVPGIAGFETAMIENQKSRELDYEKVSQLKEILFQEIKKIPDVYLFEKGKSSPYIASVAFSGIKSEILLHYLEKQGIYISTGSACAKGEVSDVLKAMHLPKRYLDGMIRISLAPEYTPGDMRTVADIISKSVKEIRSIIGGQA